MSEREPVYRPIHDEGTHLAQPRGDDDTYLGALLDDDTNKLAGQARWERVDLDDRDSSDSGSHSEPDIDPMAALVLGIALGVIAGVVTTTVVVVKKGPAIKRYWVEETMPLLKSIWRKVTRAKDPEIEQSKSSSAELVLAPPATIEPAAISTEISLALDSTKSTMGSAEAERRLLLMMLGLALAAAQMRALKDVRIVDDSKLRELKKATAMLSTNEAVAAINQILRNDHGTVDEDMLAEFVLAFDVIESDGKRLPLHAKQIEEALRLEVDE